MHHEDQTDSDLQVWVEQPASDQTVPRIGDEGEEIFPASVCEVMTELLMEPHQDNVIDFSMRSVLTWSSSKQRKPQK